MTNRRLDLIVKTQKPLVLAVDASVAEACAQMRRSGAGSALVADKAGRLAGIFTGRDAVRLLAEGREAAHVRLADAMTRDPVTVEPKSLAIDALRAMHTGGFRHVPVVSDGRIVGCVSLSDLKGMELHHLRAYRLGDPNRSLGQVIAGRQPLLVDGSDSIGHACQRMHASTYGSVLVAGPDKRLLGVFTGRDAVTASAAGTSSAAAVSSAMTRDPVTLSPDATAIEALRAMNDGGFRHLPVVEHGIIVGVVTRNDFTALEIDRLDHEEHLKEVLW